MPDATSPVPTASIELVYEEDHADMHQWWQFFWTLNGFKYPNIALDHLPQFLTEIIDQKKTLLSLVVPVSISCTANLDGEDIPCVSILGTLCQASRARPCSSRRSHSFALR